MDLPTPTARPDLRSHSPAGACGNSVRGPSLQGPSRQLCEEEKEKEEELPVTLIYCTEEWRERSPS